MSDLRYHTASPAMVKDFMEEVLFLSLEDFNDIVEVIAGKSEEELRPQFAWDVLALRSKYFRVKMKNYSYLPHGKDEHMIIDLSEQSIIALEAFFVWNTTGDIFCAERLSAVTIDRVAAVVTAEKLYKYRLLWDRLLECYFLADFLGAPAFGNAAMNALIEVIDSERECRAKLKPDVEVFASIRESMILKTIRIIFIMLRITTKMKRMMINTLKIEWENLYRDPFEEKRPRRDIRRMLGTLPSSNPKSLLRDPNLLPDPENACG
ncbi:hypothetical protein BGAL_0521g00070 [Botrytis galanthina]|uniref:BTB domain-containing protein n=1 Tax=Botrytis galanthina TaxID=278940 RepID=A0A4S8QJZ4_9HELO|nr:hypothetical protein BGAL_0521g00070 [Botrytis galanthina]